MDTQAALDSFVANLRARGSGQTLSRYTWLAHRWLNSSMASRCALTRRRCAVALVSLHAGRTVAPTLAVTLSAWRTWFRHLAKIGEADPAIFSGIKAPRGQSVCPMR